MGWLPCRGLVGVGGGMGVGWTSAGDGAVSGCPVTGSLVCSRLLFSVDPLDRPCPFVVRVHETMCGDWDDWTLIPRYEAPGYLNLLFIDLLPSHQGNYPIYNYSIFRILFLCTRYRMYLLLQLTLFRINRYVLVVEISLQISYSHCPCISPPNIAI